MQKDLERSKRYDDTKKSRKKEYIRHNIATKKETAFFLFFKKLLACIFNN